MILLRSPGCTCESVDRSNQRFKSSGMWWCAIGWPGSIFWQSQCFQLQGQAVIVCGLTA